MKLSIVIPSHNRPDLLAACLRSVCRWAPAETEIVVVDDGSAAGAVAAAARPFADVRVLHLRRRQGFCAAANAGLRATQAPIVELLNDDTEVTAGWAEAPLALFTDPAVAAVAPLVLNARKPDEIDSAGDRYYVGGIAGKRGHGTVLAGFPLRRCRVFGASASSAFFRREVVLRLGAFPESFGAYFEDVDLAFRLNRAGYQVIFEPASRVLHRGAASHGRRRRRLLEQQSCNEERVFWRNLPANVLLRALPRHGLVLVAKAVRRLQEGTLAPFLCGRLRLLGELPHLLRHRQRLRQLDSRGSPSAWPLDWQFWGQD